MANELAITGSESGTELQAKVDTFLQRSGVTRPSLSTRPLLIAWVAAVGLLLILPPLPLLVGVAGGTTLLLAAAPLAPMIAVVLAYRQATDPAGELALATPMAGFRLVASGAVAIVAMKIGVLPAQAAMPGVMLTLAGSLASVWSTRLQPRQLLPRMRA